MKSTFRHYKSNGQTDYNEIWNQSLVILDTNILLNLFRYPESVRKDYIKVLKHLKKHLWMPFIAGLEFYENLDYVVSSQVTTYSKVKSTIDRYTLDLESLANKAQEEIKKLNLNKRHFKITEEDLLETISKAFDKSKIQLDKLSSKYSPVEDKASRAIRNISSENNKQLRALESIFRNRIGEGQVTQTEIEQLNKEAKQRYDILRPPGYKDSSKNRDSKKKVLIHNNLSYKREYCDFYIWREVVEKSRKLPRGIKNIIFVTDDLKEDWWKKVNGKTIGPRVELIDEIQSFSKEKMEHFLMYDSLRFLEFAIEKYKIEIKKETLPLIKDFQKLFNIGNDEHKTYLKICDAFEEYLNNLHEEYELMPRIKSNQFVLKDDVWDLNYYELFIRSDNLKDEQDAILLLKKRYDLGELNEYYDCTLVVMELSHKEYIRNKSRVLELNSDLTKRLSILHGYVSYDRSLKKLSVLL